ncbi:MAG TPA: glycosyltransferase family A protein, partial [Terriglobales bacterium]|nr:glycosyltransferase family A protein [Terriglobales bacterium]
GSRFVVISPVRDEVGHLEKSIRSMVRQTIRPTQWIVVNDGSKDATGAILDRWAQTEPWIDVVHRADRGRREPGKGVVEAFYDGFRRISAEWDFVVKLDGDLEFEPTYFEKCLAEFQADPKLGIAGGVICHRVNGALEPEPNPAFHVRGASKIYRRGCWEQIGGLLPIPGWDTADELKANMLGWSTRSIPHLLLEHQRFTGSAIGDWQNAIKNGMGSYVTGYHPLFMLLRCTHQVFHRPYLVGSVGLLYGYVLGCLHRVPQVADRDLIRYVRQQQLRRMLSSATVWK